MKTQAESALSKPSVFFFAWACLITFHFVGGGGVAVLDNSLAS